MRTFDEIARASPEYVEALYQQFRRDPASVDERWALLFKGYEFGAGIGAERRFRGDAWPGGGRPRPRLPRARPSGRRRRSPGSRTPVTPASRSRRVRLSRDATWTARWTAGPSAAWRPPRSASCWRRCERSYCGTLGVEYLSLSDKAQREWLQERIERSGNHAGPDRRGPPPHPRAARGRRDVRAVPPREVRRPEALLARGRRGADPAARRARRGRGGSSARARS